MLTDTSDPLSRQMTLTHRGVKVVATQLTPQSLWVCYDPEGDATVFTATHRAPDTEVAMLLRLALKQWFRRCAGELEGTP